jgi:methylthioribose-1-phosphate isomerase
MSRKPTTIRWVGGTDGYLEIIDQRALPMKLLVRRLQTLDDAWDAIKTLVVRGAPAIGVTAGYAMVLATRDWSDTMAPARLLTQLAKAGAYLCESRPTAVNLAWAVQRMCRVARAAQAAGEERGGMRVAALRQRLLAEARAIFDEDVAMCGAIGRHGARFIRPHTGVLTHCNAGSLATSEKDGIGGTALAIIYEAQRRKVPFQVYADETRPLLQGARLTAWELQRAGVDVTVICDNMAGLVMRQGKVSLVIVGADRIAANGDTANKVGTYSVALLAAAHGVPFVVAAPSSTFDLALATGEGIPIEERKAEEITAGFGKCTVPPGVRVYNPAFDVTPAQRITAIVTERGVITPVTKARIKAVLGSAARSGPR